MWAWVENVIPWSSKVTLIRPLCLGMSLCGYKRKKIEPERQKRYKKMKTKKEKRGVEGLEGGKEE